MPSLWGSCASRRGLAGLNTASASRHAIKLPPHGCVPNAPLSERGGNDLQDCYAIAPSPWLSDRISCHTAARAHSELARLVAHPDRATLKALARFVWVLAVEKGEPAVWLMREFQPETTLAFLLCMKARVPLKNLFAGRLTEAHFASLIRRAGQLGGAPLHVAVVPSTRTFRNAMLARQRLGKVNVIGDWIPSEAELLIAMDSGIRVVFPAIPQSKR